MLCYPRDSISLLLLTYPAELVFGSFFSPPGLRWKQAGLLASSLVTIATFERGAVCHGVLYLEQQEFGGATAACIPLPWYA